MHSYKAIDLSFLSFQTENYQFYIELIKIKTLLYHSMHQTPEYLFWLDTMATDSNKSFLQKMSNQILEELLIGVVIYTSQDIFLNEYKLIKYSVLQGVPSSKICDYELSTLHDASIALHKSIADSKRIFESCGRKSFSNLEKNLPRILFAILNTMESSQDWKVKIKKINTYLFDVSELLNIDHHFAKAIGITEIITYIRALSSQITTYVTHMLHTFVNKFNYQQLNIWGGLINKMMLDCHNGDMIKENLDLVLKHTDLYKVISKNIRTLSDIEKQFILFMKGLDENSCTNDFSKIKDNKLLKRMGIKIVNTPTLCATHMFELGNLILKGKEVVPHPLLACEFFELAYIYADNENEKLLAYCQMEASYKISVSGGYTLSFYDEAHIGFHQYLKYIKVLNSNKMTSNQSPSIILDELKCQVAKFEIDIICGNNHKEVPNKNLLNILFILERHYSAFNAEDKIKLNTTLSPLIKLYNTDKLGECNAEMIRKVTTNFTDYHSETYNSNKVNVCRIQ